MLTKPKNRKTKTTYISTMMMEKINLLNKFIKCHINNRSKVVREASGTQLILQQAIEIATEEALDHLLKVEILALRLAHRSLLIKFMQKSMKWKKLIKK